MIKLVNLLHWIADSPVVKGRNTNDQFKCDCDAVPSIYSVYQLNQLSKYGELVRSVNLNNEIFSYTSYLFQRNGIYTCVVSNGIPDIKGNVLQTWSTNVKYEGTRNKLNTNAYMFITVVIFIKYPIKYTKCCCSSFNSFIKFLSVCIIDTCFYSFESYLAILAV